MTTDKQLSTSYMTFIGISLVVLGILAIITPYIAGKMVILIIGGIMIIAGISYVLQGLRTGGGKNKWFMLILGIIALICGVLVLGHPLFGLTYLTLLLAIYFIVEGICKILMSIRYRHVTAWVWLLLTGLLSLVLGLLIWNQWPSSGLWVIGLLVGINLFVTGISMMMLSAGIKRLSIAKT